MFKIIAVTNRNLCEKDFILHLKKLAEASVDAIILREKDLSQEKYQVLVTKALYALQGYGSKLIAHGFFHAAKAAGCTSIHLPLLEFASNAQLAKEFCKVGVSVHSVEEARLAEDLGANYLIAGHIFDTDCKRGAIPRGIEFLQEVCRAVSLPVYAIGGINHQNINQIKQTKASGACLMSALMQTNDIANYLKILR